MRVGVFDGGCLTSHEDLKNVVGASCLAETEQSRISHGTHVAGIIAAEWNETGGFPACAPRPPLAVVDCDAAGQGLSTSSFLYGVAFSYLIGEQHCRVVNVSLGFNEELSYAASHGVMFAQLQAQAMGRGSWPITFRACSKPLRPRAGLCDLRCGRQRQQQQFL